MRGNKSKKNFPDIQIFLDDFVGGQQDARGENEERQPRLKGFL